MVYFVFKISILDDTKHGQVGSRDRDRSLKIKGFTTSQIERTEKKLM